MDYISCILSLSFGAGKGTVMGEGSYIYKVSRVAGGSA